VARGRKGTAAAGRCRRPSGASRSFEACLGGWGVPFCHVAATSSAAKKTARPDGMPTMRSTYSIVLCSFDWCINMDKFVI
jgi:hypothetical protein